MKIKELREQAGMTKTELAAILRVDLSTVCKWETGTNKPTADGILKLADLFGCTIDELYGREPPDGHNPAERRDKPQDT